MHQKSKTAEELPPELSPAVREQFGKDLVGMGTICFGSGGELQRYPIEDLEKFFLDAAVAAALRSCGENPRWFLGQKPENLPDRFFPVLIRAAYASVPERNHDWLGRLIERPGVADRLEDCLKAAFAAKRKVMPLVPRSETEKRFREIETALRAGKDAQALVREVTGMHQAALAKVVKMTETMVSRILRARKNVLSGNIELFLQRLARLLKS
jgi:hypothetical protein